MEPKKIAIITLVVLALGAGITYYVVSQRDDVRIERLSELGRKYDEGDIDGAISEGEALVGTDAEDADALLVLAASYAQKGSVSFDEKEYGQKAIDAATRALELNATSSEAYRIIGYANEIMQRYDEAHAAYDKAIILDPLNSQAYSNKGHAYDLQGDQVRARQHYQQALSVDNSNTHALLNLARIHIRAAEAAPAKLLLDRVVAIAANAHVRAEAYQMIAILALASQPPDYVAAEEALDASLELDASIPQTWVQLGFVKYRTLLQTATDQEMEAQMQEVDAAVRTALQLNPNQASALYLAHLMAKIRGDEDRAEQLRQDALTAIPFDITLGETEKRELESTLNATFTLTGDEEVIQ
jgi:tetratricopeptide (TPR) repeat protein